MVLLMFNFFICFGVKKYKVVELFSEFVLSDEKVIDILNKLVFCELMGNVVIVVVEFIVVLMCVDGQDVFCCFFLKDLKVGVGISLCNKVFENFILKFEVQLVLLYKEKGDKYFFKLNFKVKWLMIGSFKFDGL